MFTATKTVSHFQKPCFLGIFLNKSGCQIFLKHVYIYTYIYRGINIHTYVVKNKMIQFLAKAFPSRFINNLFSKLLNYTFFSLFISNISFDCQLKMRKIYVNTLSRKIQKEHKCAYLSRNLCCVHKNIYVQV